MIIVDNRLVYTKILAIWEYIEEKCQSDLVFMHLGPFLLLCRLKAPESLYLILIIFLFFLLLSLGKCQCFYHFGFFQLCNASLDMKSDSKIWTNSIEHLDKTTISLDLVKVFRSFWSQIVNPWNLLLRIKGAELLNGIVSSNFKSGIITSGLFENGL